MGESLHPTDPQPLVDPFGRRITYLRLSVTDRCNFRCTYCMAERMTFLPRREVLTLEELYEIGAVFVALGVRKIRLTGGEPLVRRGLLSLAERLGALAGLEELALTTNGALLAPLAEPLRRAGVASLNLSLDSLRPERFRRLTRTGELAAVLEGLEAARRAGFPRIRLNAVIQAGVNDDEVVELAEFALERGLDIAFIEEMPLGAVDSHDRRATAVPSLRLRERLAARFPLVPAADTTGGPARYFRIPGRGERIGFISPLSENFCATCNRVRLTAEGRLLLCLGHEDAVDLKAVVRRHPGDRERLAAAIRAAILHKPERHHFDPGRVDVVRFMNATGG
ncbi:MAG: GTP 3',8-cyclase 2 [Porticoccaceae bacterium]|nr:MAG: GTP 3',8-cyclase 2 [Porticoccaceae bacterium]